jgi:hypothetical protein
MNAPPKPQSTPNHSPRHNPIQPPSHEQRRARSAEQAQHLGFQPAPQASAPEGYAPWQHALAELVGTGLLAQQHTQAHQHKKRRAQPVRPGQALALL